ncbi:unnamed protein product [Caenorhabditis brenneri]
MTNEEEVKRSEIFKKSYDIAKNLMVNADTFFPQFNDEKTRQVWKDTLSVVTEAGNVVRRFENGSGNQIAKNMLELAGGVEKLYQKTCTNVANMKLLAERNFCKKVLSSTYLLTRYMKDFIAHPGQKSQEKFQNAYKTHGPLKLVYLLTSILEIEATNPLKIAMAAENGKTKATFQMWEDTIKFSLSLLMFIEAFAGGQSLDLMIGKTGKVVKDLATWKEGYKKNEGYWTEMHAYLPKWLNENSKLSNKEKANHIKAKMDSYLTNDAFYISVFDHYYNGNQYWDDIRVGKDQFINCYGPGGGNNFVYRSKLANKAGLATMEEFRVKVQSYKRNGYKDKIIDALSKNPIPNVGFYIVYGGLNEEIRDSNFTLRADGPGWWTYSFDFGGPHERKLFIGYL